jgi:hypothetical protein
VNGNPEFRKAWLFAIWRDLTTEPDWKYQELPPFLLPELIKLDLIEASDSELPRVMWFWLRRPRLTLHEGTALMVVALCALLPLTIAFVDWPLTWMMKRAAAADEQAGPQDARGLLHGEMPDTASAARDIDGVAGLDSAVEAREGGEEAHRHRCRREEAQGFGFGDGQELPRQRVLTSAVRSHRGSG